MQLLKVEVGALKTSCPETRLKLIEWSEQKIKELEGEVKMVAAQQGSRVDRKEFDDLLHRMKEFACISDFKEL